MRIQKFFTSTIANHLTRLATSTAVAALLYGGSPSLQPANAQSATANQVSDREGAVSYDDQTVRSFAAAAATVLALRGEYYPRIRAAEFAGSKEKADLLFEQMREQMHAAIRNSGFTPEQYRAISAVAKTDAVLRERISAILKRPKPAQRRQQNVTRLEPQTPQVAAAKNDAAPIPKPPAPATPPAAAAAPSAAQGAADDTARQRLEAELRKASAERDRHRAEQIELQKKTEELERQLSAVKARDSKLRERLNTEKARALAAQQKSQAELDALLGEVTTLKDELATVRQSDTALREQLVAERILANAEQRSKEAKLAAFRDEIARLAGQLANAQQALDALADDLKPGQTGLRKPSFEALAPLNTKPTSVERILERTQPQYALRQELNSEIARSQKERRDREAERTALQQEIAQLSSELATAYQAIADLINEPPATAVATAELDTQYETYALDVSQETAQLFEGVPSQFDQAFTDAETSVLFDPPFPLDIDDPLVEPGSSEPADTVALEPDAVAPFELNPPAVEQIASTSAMGDTRAADLLEDDILDFVAASAVDIDPPKAESQTSELDASNAQQPVSVSGTVQDGAKAYKAADYRRAYKIWAMLAESGSVRAQFHLGALYFEGRGTNADFDQAFFWLRVAAYQGNQRAFELLETVAKKLTDHEITASDDRARGWLEQRSITPTQFVRNSTDRR